MIRNWKRRRELRLFVGEGNHAVGTWWQSSIPGKPITQAELDRAFRDAGGKS